MEEIRSLVRKDSVFRNEAKELITEAIGSNLATKDALLKLNIIKSKELEFACKIAGEAIESYEAQLEQDENIISDLKDKIGDGKVTDKIIAKHRDKSISQEAQNKYRSRGLARLSALAKTSLAKEKDSSAMKAITH